jgi:hypothetical protein
MTVMILVMTVLGDATDFESILCAEGQFYFTVCIFFFVLSNVCYTQKKNT